MLAGVIVFIVIIAGAGLWMLYRSRTSGKSGMDLQFNGVYRKEDQEYSYYLRFFPDGKVVGVSSTGSPSEVIRWLNHDYDNNGTYVIRRSKISFTITSSSGRVDYSGTMKDGDLILSLHSHINGNSSTNARYSFHPC